MFRKRISTTLLATLAFTALVPACDDGGTDDAFRDGDVGDLGDFGVAQVAGTSDDLSLLDERGAAIGHVSIDDGKSTSISVELKGHVASVQYDNDTATLQCDDGPVIAAGSATDDASAAASTEACDDALGVASELVRSGAVTPPTWVGIESVDEDAGRFCTTVTTWVFGGSCWGCLGAAKRRLGRGQGWIEGPGGSCSSGAVWTSCTHTFCLAGVQD